MTEKQREAIRNFRIGKCPVYFRGTRKTLWRVVYADKKGGYFVKWYGDFVEVRRGLGGYFETVKDY